MLILTLILTLLLSFQAPADESRAAIVSAEEGVYTISVGAAEGVETGTTFTVFRTGKVLEDPQTGARMERPGIKYGTMTVTEVPEKGGAKCSYEGKDLDLEELEKYHIVKSK